MKKVYVIGSGFAGLSAATMLAAKGYDVTVLEKNDTFGGRGRKFEEDGFVFDMGPSWYWMPEVFEKYFNLFGKSTSDYYELIRLNPSYKVFYGKNDEIELPSDLNELYNLFDKIEPGAGLKLKGFLEEAKYKYEVGINNLVYKPGQEISELIDKDLIKGLFKLDVFKSISKHIKERFKNPKLVQLLEFPVLFLGATPADTPALYSLMNYADMALGTWYPKGGMHKIGEAMYKLAIEVGVKLKFNSPVLSIKNLGKNLCEIKTTNGLYTADIVVGAADYNHIEQVLLDEKDRNYSINYWNKRVMAPSSLIFYLGVNKKLNQLLHHNLFFDQDFGLHSNEIYKNPQWPSNPLFYACLTSKTDPSVAPAGHENLFILIPVAPGLTDTAETRDKYFRLIMKRLEYLTGEEIEKHIVYKRSYAHNNFISDYNSFKGNAYGLANTLLQTAHLKPSIRSKKINNLFFTGQLTVPGPGVPPAIISGQVVAKEIEKEFKN
jgi:phytoene desaturase